MPCEIHRPQYKSEWKKPIINFRGGGGNNLHKLLFVSKTSRQKQEYVTFKLIGMSHYQGGHILGVVAMVPEEAWNKIKKRIINMP